MEHDVEAMTMIVERFPLIKMENAGHFFWTSTFFVERLNFSCWISEIIFFGGQSCTQNADGWKCTLLKSSCLCFVVSCRSLCLFRRRSLCLSLCPFFVFVFVLLFVFVFVVVVVVMFVVVVVVVLLCLVLPSDCVVLCFTLRLCCVVLWLCCFSCEYLVLSCLVWSWLLIALSCRVCNCVVLHCVVLCWLALSYLLLCCVSLSSLVSSSRLASTCFV